MDTIILLENVDLNESDLKELNSDVINGIVFCATNQKNFLPNGAILVIIDLVQNLGYNAAYDILKFVIFKLVTFFENKTKDKETKFDLVCNEKRVSLNCNFPLTKKQKAQLIDAAIEKMLKE